MFCQICGARVPNGRSACVQCGAPVGRTASYNSPVAVQPSRGASVELRSCPRCGYHGPSQSYFSSGLHLLGLLGAMAVFFPAAFLYLALRHSHRICPKCGLDWGKEAALALPSGDGERLALSDIPPEVAGMGEGRGKRFMSWLLFVLAVPFLIGGLVGAEAAALMFAFFFAGGGYLLRRASNEDRLRRREAMLQSLQRPVLQLAAQRGGTLTVSQVAAEYGWSLPRAEKVLQSLEDGYRVVGDVTDDGVIVYNFLELTAAPAAPSAGEPLDLPPRQRLEPSPLQRPADGGSTMGMGQTG